MSRSRRLAVTFAVVHAHRAAAADDWGLQQPQLRSRWKMMSRSQWAKEGDEVAPKSQWEQKSSPGRARPWSKELV